MSWVNKILKGALIVILGMIINKIFMLVFRLITARLGTQEYGLFTIGFSIHGAILVLSLMGMDYGVMRYTSYYLGKKDNKKIAGTILSGLLITLIISVILSTALFIYSNYIATHFFNSPGLTPILHLFCLAIPFSVMSSVAYSVIRAFKKVNYIVYVQNILNSLVLVGLTLLLINMGWGIISAAIAFLVGTIINVLIFYYLINKNLVNLFKTRVKKAFNFRELFKYSWPLTFYYMVSSLILYSDSIVLGNISGARSVGIYNAIAPIAFLLMIVPTAALTLFTPIINQAYANKKMKEIKEISQIISKWIFYGGVILSVFIIIFRKQIIGLLFGSEYISGATALIILSIGILFYTLSQVSTDLLNMQKKTKIVSKNILAVLIMNLGLNYALIPRMGVEGAALATAISLFIFSVLCIYEAYYFSKINTFGKNMLKLFDKHDRKLIKNMISQIHRKGAYKKNGKNKK